MEHHTGVDRISIKDDDLQKEIQEPKTKVVKFSPENFESSNVLEFKIIIIN